MSSSGYRITKKGKIVCLLLALSLAAVLYFAISNSLTTRPEDQDSGAQPNQSSPGQITEGGLSGSATEPGLTTGSGTTPQKQTDTDSSQDDILVKKISVYFDPESSALTNNAKNTLNQFVEEITGLADYHVVLEANCATTLKSPLPDDARLEHQDLAASRGSAVSDYLLQNNINVTRLTNLGADNPGNDNSTFSKRIQNRRVDIYLYK